MLVTGTWLWLSRNSWEWNVIIPTDFRCPSFFRGVGQRPTRYIYNLYIDYINHLLIHSCWLTFFFQPGIFSQLGIPFGFLVKSQRSRFRHVRIVWSSAEMLQTAVTSPFTFRWRHLAEEKKNPGENSRNSTCFCYKPIMDQPEGQKL